MLIQPTSDSSSLSHHAEQSSDGGTDQRADQMTEAWKSKTTGKGGQNMRRETSGRAWLKQWQWGRRTEVQERRIASSFIKLWLNQWCHMNYFNDDYLSDYSPDCLSGPWMCQLCCCLCRVRNLSDFIKYIVICVTKMNEGLGSLERHEGE